jgi:Anp1
MTELPKVLVLTPVKDAAAFLDTYVGLFEALDWPRDRLSLGILEGDSVDMTWTHLNSLRSRFEARAQRVVLTKKDFGFRLPAGLPRWTAGMQLARRQVLARARNQLLFRSLGDEDFVLWVDVDLVAYPRDVLLRLIGTGFDIVTPDCVLKPNGPSFDRNAWAEGGAVTLDMRRGTGPVRLQSVGGTMLLVKADLHRDGLIFPPFRYGNESPNARTPHPYWDRGEIETEGLGLMALDMGLQPWGIPDIQTIHAAQ